MRPRDRRVRWGGGMFVDPAQTPTELMEPSMEPGQPPNMEQPTTFDITDVQRLTLKPGDRLIVRTDQRLSPASADLLRQYVRAQLGLPGDVQVVILDRGMSLEVAEDL